MKPEDLGKAYDQITHLWGDDFNLENGIIEHQRALRFAPENGLALDVGCGPTGRFFDLLTKAGFKVEGIDVSEKMLKLARERHPEVQFTHADICDYPLDKQYDFISAWDSIWHVPLGDQAKVMSKLANALKPGGVLIFTFGGLDASSEHRDSSMGVEVYYATLGTEGFLRLLMELGMSIRHLEFNQHPDLHTYCIAQKPLTLQQE